MIEISPHQGTKSQWIEAPPFLPISEILSLTWEIVVDPDYMGTDPSSPESRLFTISTDELSRELFLLGNISKSSGQQEFKSTYKKNVPM